jgi:hypothetical protein
MRTRRIGIALLAIIAVFCCGPLLWSIPAIKSKYVKLFVGEMMDGDRVAAVVNDGTPDPFLEGYKTGRRT